MFGIIERLLDRVRFERVAYNGGPGEAPNCGQIWAKPSVDASLAHLYATATDIRGCTGRDNTVGESAYVTRLDSRVAGSDNGDLTGGEPAAAIEDASLDAIRKDIGW